MEKIEKLEKLVRALDDKHVEKMIVLDMRKHSSLYDFMVVSTGKNDRIIAGALRELKDLNGEDGFTLKYIEGHGGGEWVLADFGDIVVHVFNEDMRQRVHIEKLWGDAKRIDLSGWLN